MDKHYKINTIVEGEENVCGKLFPDRTGRNEARTDVFCGTVQSVLLDDRSCAWWCLRSAAAF